MQQQMGSHASHVQNKLGSPGRKWICPGSSSLSASPAMRIQLAAPGATLWADVKRRSDEERYHCTIQYNYCLIFLAHVIGHNSFPELASLIEMGD